MTRCLTALLVFLLAGCTTPEPQNAAYVPDTPNPAAMPAPSVPASGDQPMHVSPGGMSAAPAPQPGCSTVDGVTLCDAPYDPAADDTRYTN